MSEFKCRICGDKKWITILETDAPLAADVTDTPKIEMKRFPLHVVRCNACGHVQLKETLEASFYGEYLYTPSYASGFVQYVESFAEKITKEIKKENRRVIEIGSSNGYLLGKLKEKGWEVLGVEPSDRLSREANENGIRTYRGFFSKATVSEIKSIIGKPDVLIFRHVMEHLDDLGGIVAAINELLGDGLLVIEVPYLKRIVKEDQFYAFFHEHLSYYSVTALNNLLKTGGFYVHRVYENNLEGGSILILADNDSCSRKGDNVREYLENERTDLSEYEIMNFSKRIRDNIASMKDIVEEARMSGKSVAAWGAGQRGCTLISMCGFQSSELKYVVDVNKNYWDKYVPGTDIMIVSPDRFKENWVDNVIIFATGYADSIIEENYWYVENGGRFVRIT